MAKSSKKPTNQGFATEKVPTELQGSGWSVFFIVAGSLCGLPVFILSAKIFGGLGFVRGLQAVLIGALISAGLGACTAYAGSKSRLGLAMLADQAFGSLGARIVKLVITISLVGWFGVNIGVLGATAADALAHMSVATVPPLAIGLPVCLAIAAVTLFGATGLERLGKVLVPVTLLILLTSVVLVAARMDEVWATRGSGSLSFGQAVSAIVGSYIVGIVIQPDYGRFVRRPAAAASGTAAALGIAYPAVLTLSSMASLTLRAPELISAMIILGFGLPALAVLLMGAWIDSSACLYSASLSLVNQLPRFRLPHVVIAVTAIGVVLVVLGADKAFIPFLVTLGVSLPPLAAVLVVSTVFLSAPQAVGGQSKVDRHVLPLVSWAIGTLVGECADRELIALTGLATLDSIIAATVVMVFADWLDRRIAVKMIVPVHKDIETPAPDHQYLKVEFVDR